MAKIKIDKKIVGYRVEADDKDRREEVRPEGQSKG